MVRRLLSVGLLAAGLSGCTPDFNDTTSIVTSPRLLAVQGEPAEGPTGSAFTQRVLYVNPGGSADASTLAWAACLLQKPLGDPTSVNPGCLAVAGSGLDPLGRGPLVHGTIPANACELFGPESPPPMAGQPGARPTDPDSTGGYYLPIRILAPGGDDSVAFERIACQPSGITPGVFTAFSNGYVANDNPVVSSLAVAPEAGATTTIAPYVAGSVPGLTAPRGATLSLRAAWPTCPDTPVACGGAETYLLIDPTTKEITTARESMVVSWYASAGTFAQERVGLAANDLGTSVNNTWTAPSVSGVVLLWVVLRDARGGVGWATGGIQAGP